jgi:hypothetical protein
MPVNDGTLPVTKPEFLRELGRVDVEPLKQLVARVSESVWDVEDAQKENRFAVFHHTRHIVFRFIAGMRDHRQFYSTPIWSAWQSRLQPVMDDAIVEYGFRQPVFPKVMLARLAAGAVIDRHVDGAGSNLFTHKIHVPLQTSAEARMFIRDRSFHLEEGCVYEVNNIVPHAVENRGSMDRIHLIFEVFDAANQGTT